MNLIFLHKKDISYRNENKEQLFIHLQQENKNTILKCNNLEEQINKIINKLDFVLQEEIKEQKNEKRIDHIEDTIYGAQNVKANIIQLQQDLRFIRGRMEQRHKSSQWVNKIYIQWKKIHDKNKDISEKSKKET